MSSKSRYFEITGLSGFYKGKDKASFNGKIVQVIGIIPKGSSIKVASDMVVQLHEDAAYLDYDLTFPDGTILPFIGVDYLKPIEVKHEIIDKEIDKFFK